MNCTRHVSVRAPTVMVLACTSLPVQVRIQAAGRGNVVMCGGGEGLGNTCRRE